MPNIADDIVEDCHYMCICACAHTHMDIHTVLSVYAGCQLDFVKKKVFLKGLIFKKKKVFATKKRFSVPNG